jgi:hypothetical protein
MQDDYTTSRSGPGSRAAIGVFIAGFALFGDLIVGAIVILLAALANPFVVWAISAATIALINVACCHWVVREWASFIDGPGAGVAKRIDSLRDARLTRRPIAWLSEAGDGRFALAAILTNAITAVTAARAFGTDVNRRRVLIASVAFAVVSCGLHATFGFIIGEVVRGLA